MGSVSVSSCKCRMFVSCVHSMGVLNAAFCMATFSLWIAWSVAFLSFAIIIDSTVLECLVNSGSLLLSTYPSCL